MALAEALDRPFVIKQLAWPVADADEDRVRVRALLADTAAARRQREALGLHAPWPRLVLCCGRRADRVGFWIKRQSHGATKVVSIGRARRPLAAYDLLVAPPQFALPKRSNVIHLPLPLARPRRARAPQPTDNTRPIIPVPKPWFTILLGGKVKQFAASEGRLVKVAKRAQLAAKLHGGSVIVSTSRRTPPALLAAVERVLDRPFIYRWSPAGTMQNPYDTLLHQSAALFVTADSVSMIADACEAGTPTYVIEYPDRQDLRRRWRADLFNQIRSIIGRCRDWGLERTGCRLERLQDWLHAKHILRYPRDLRRFHASVYGMGLARPAEAFDPAVMPVKRMPANDLIEISGVQEVAARCLTLHGRAARVAAE
jgi:hypothetical protein